MGGKGQAGDDPQQGDAVAGLGGESGFDQCVHGVHPVGGSGSACVLRDRLDEFIDFKSANLRF
ncbi:hypothetical protein D3C78_1761590 [compost metagenome]